MPQPKAFFQFLITTVILSAIIPVSSAHAGVFDRIKDIYNTPDKIHQLEQQYLNSKQQLEDTIVKQKEQFESTLQEQQEQLDEALNAAETLSHQQQELIMQNEQIQQLNAQYKQHNDQLAQQNALLLSELEHAKQQRRSTLDKLISSLIIIIVMIAVYFAAMRVWRFITWRKYSRSAGRGLSR